MAEFEHTTVLLHEAVAALKIDPAGIYVDCTLGGGGHSREILKQLGPNGHLFSFDQDQTAIDYNQTNLAEYLASGQLTFVKSNFANLKSELAARGITRVDGVVYDLGVSSPQFDNAARGFSYQHDAPLDMRMDQSQVLTAKTVVNTWPYADLVRIFYRYGEEKFSKQVARAIERERDRQPIETTGELVDLIKEAIPARARRTGGHPAKRVFQAIRIAVNNELGVLETSLEQAVDLIKIHGRVSVITFQSLEDRLVKTIFKEHSDLPELPPGLPVIPAEMQPDYRLVNRKPIVPSDAEVAANRRARSAKLRAIERLRIEN
ncbi:16S rRNA (cytosine(1402)-N(4))-methyltransferase RsmH [Lactiplantibacillus garii]|uniref:Ribosomal RNA small subunit methyltransferase H n=1 Tax=Lactiplantibacillus garii TaxID=2306423 RepID=A0A3R8J9L3_9LACO|nr:16S rRNA (cytosine(1402)-N(4))-methyltransferase RsmH [Lactiplantibacillus garii]RRK11566.1 16S rRNA (cytosine(1402)-N(4))-methyltransferase RsmH [Lactiplantibacillus garii]